MEVVSNATSRLATSSLATSSFAVFKSFNDADCNAPAAVRILQ
jgi:hypothetical protein